MAAPYILARTFAEAHTFAREDLGLQPGHYRVVNSAGTLKAVRGADLYLVPGWDSRFDRFPIKTALRWTRMNVIDVAERQAEEPAEGGDDLDRVGEQTTIEDANAFLLAHGTPDAEIKELVETDGLKPEGVQLTLVPDIKPEPAPEPEVAPKKRRRSRCKQCGTLHYRGDPCPEVV